jgi:cell fate regulator YaaT (PSP1 superfamily)
MKEQNLALNPSKISGVCGRLMCCLAYEYEMYVELKKDFPKVGKRIRLPQGEGKVIKHNALGATITIEMDDGKELTLPAKEVIDNMHRS